jgi:hypothetical protein
VKFRQSAITLNDFAALMNGWFPDGHKSGMLDQHLQSAFWQAASQ